MSKILQTWCIFVSLPQKPAESIEELNTRIRSLLEIRNRTSFKGRNYSRLQQFEEMEQTHLQTLVEKRRVNQCVRKRLYWQKKTQKTKTKNKAISKRKKHTVTSSNCELTFGGQFAAKNSGQFARNFHYIQIQSDRFAKLNQLKNLSHLTRLLYGLWSK